MKKFFVVILILTTTVLLGCMNNAEKFIVGIDDNFPPMGFRDENNDIVGFDIDLAKETAKRMGVEFEFKPIDWNNKEAEITSGNIDMIWNGLVINDERKKYMLFSKPYMDDRQIILVKEGNPHNIYAFGDLYGKVVGWQAGSNSEAYITKNPKIQNSFKEFKTYPNVKDGFEALIQDKIDALIINEIVARYEMIKNPKTFELVEVTVGPLTEFGVGFRKDDTELRDKVQKAFNSMVADGTAKKISEKWFQADLIKYKK